jgi:hypothetical protein
MLKTSAGLRVEQERMIPSVPSHVHETDKGPVLRARSDPAKALSMNPIPPSSLRAAPVGVDQLNDFAVVQPPAPQVGDVFSHFASLAQRVASPAANQVSQNSVSAALRESSSIGTHGCLI